MNRGSHAGTSRQVGRLSGSMQEGTGTRVWQAGRKAGRKVSCMQRSRQKSRQGSRQAAGPPRSRGNKQALSRALSELSEC